MKIFLDSLAEKKSEGKCKLIEYDGDKETYLVNKNTLFGRIIHGVFHEGSCLGVNGDLFIDNLKIYNELYLNHDKDDYSTILTENVKEILPEFNDNIDLYKFEYTHPSPYNLFMRKPGLEEYY